MNIQLSQDQSLQVVYNNIRQLNNRNRYNFNTKFHWNCLNCFTDIYVSDRQFGINAIYCDSCQPKIQSPNIIQYHYMRRLKEKQLEVMQDGLKRTDISEHL